MDVAVARRDQGAVQQYLSGWDFQYAVPGSHDPVVFNRWEAGQILGKEIHGSWAREKSDSSWRFEFLLHEINEGVWSFRYCPEVQHSLESIGGQTSEGISFLKPEIALLYKAARLRDVDQEDFQRVLPRLASEQKNQLREDISRFSPQHPWIGMLSR